MIRLATCSLCGHRFDPAAGQACASCPIAPNCSLVCCPRCGHVGVDPGRSRLARALLRLQAGRSATGRSAAGRSLADLPRDAEAKVTGVAPALGDELIGRLHAYGLTPGCDVAVIQRRPVIVLAVDRTELAIEEDIARHIAVETES